MKLLTTRQMFVTLACLAVLAPFCLIYYFTECGEEVGCGGRPVLFTMNVVVWTLVLLVNFLFARDNPRGEKSLRPDLERPELDLLGVLGAALAVGFAVLCGSMLHEGLYNRYCLDELCSNLEGGSQMIDTVTVVFIVTLLMIILGISEYRRNRR